VRLQGAEQQTIAKAMVPLMELKRGGSLKPIESITGPQIPDFDTFQQLKSLGYLEE